MSTLKLTSGDLDTSGGLTLLSELGEETRQRLEIKLRFFKGEWFQDDRIGIPYYEKILKKAPRLPEIRAVYRRALLGDPAVESVNSMKLDFNRATRTLAVSFEATLNDGSSLVFEDFILGATL